VADSWVSCTSKRAFDWNWLELNHKFMREQLDTRSIFFNMFKIHQNTVFRNVWPCFAICSWFCFGMRSFGMVLYGLGILGKTPKFCCDAAPSPFPHTALPRSSGGPAAHPGRCGRGAANFRPRRLINTCESNQVNRHVWTSHFRHRSCYVGRGKVGII
jgi:hypothetical protein